MYLFDLIEGSSFNGQICGGLSVRHLINAPSKVPGGEVSELENSINSQQAGHSVPRLKVKTWQCKRCTFSRPGLSLWTNPDMLYVMNNYQLMRWLHPLTKARMTQDPCMWHPVEFINFMSTVCKVKSYQDDPCSTVDIRRKVHWVNIDWYYPSVISRFPIAV